MRRFLIGPAISRLTATPLMTVNDRLHAGVYGPTFRRGGKVYAGLDGVEAHTGIKFTEAQIELAVEGRPERVLRIPDPNEQDAADGHAEAQA